MKEYNLEEVAKKLLTPNIVNMLSTIHEYRGKQDLYIESKKDTLNKLLDIAKIQSTEASNKIEGIETTSIRIKELMEDKVKPQNRNEEEIAGYRDVLNMIHENYEYIKLNPNYILQMHKNLYKYSSKDGGNYKMNDNVIQEIDSSGQRKVRFQPVSAVETPFSVDKLCLGYSDAISNHEIDPLLLIPIFILDFLSIHPFTDGNGNRYLFQR